MVWPCYNERWLISSESVYTDINGEGKSGIGKKRWMDRVENDINISGKGISPQGTEGSWDVGQGLRTHPNKE